MNSRITSVIEDLLDISQLTAGRLELHVEPIDLPALVQAAVDETAVTAEKHRIRVVKSDPVVVHGDRERLQQVLMHLLENAVKYSPQGGDVDVAVTVAGHEAIVSVMDQGVGIPKEKQSRIFERFYSAHSGTPQDYGGMGIGLFISKEIVARHGGRMWFESPPKRPGAKPAKGSVFYFALPLS